MIKIAGSCSRRVVFLKAWAIAREAAARFGGKPRTYLAASLRMA